MEEIKDNGRMTIDKLKEETADMEKGNEKIKKIEDRNLDKRRIDELNTKEYK